MIRPWFAFTVAVRESRAEATRRFARREAAVAATALAAFRCNAQRWRWLTVATEGVRNHRVFVARSNAFGAWAKLARDTSTSLERHAEMRKHRVARLIVDAWFRRVMTLKLERTLAKRRLVAMRGYKKVGAWRLVERTMVAWCEMTDAAARGRFAVQTMRRSRVARLVVRRWRERVLAARAFHATFRRAAARTTAVHLARHFFAWRVSSAAVVSSRDEIVREAKKKRESATRRRACRAWAAAVADAARDADATDRAVRHAVRRLLWRVRLGFAAWRSFANDAAFRANVARAKERMAIAVARRRIAALASRCFRAWWREGVVTRRARDAFRERTRDRRLRALVRDWRVAARLGPRTRGAERDAAKRAARRADVVETRNSARILRAWRRETTRKTRGRDVSRRAAERRVTRVATRALLEWRVVALDAADARETRARNFARRRESATTRRRLHVAFAGWKATSQAASQTASRVASRVASHRASRALLAWRRRAEGWRRTVAALAAARDELASRFVSSTLRAWCSAARRDADARRDATSRERRISSRLVASTRRRAAAAMRAWFREARLDRVGRSRGVRFAARRVDLAQRRAMDRWRRATSRRRFEEDVKRNAARASARRNARRVFIASFCAWARRARETNVAETRRAEETERVAARAATRVARRTRARVFREWRAATVRVVAAVAIADARFDADAAARTARCFASWATLARARPRWNLKNSVARRRLETFGGFVAATANSERSLGAWMRRWAAATADALARREREDEDGARGARGDEDGARDGARGDEDGARDGARGALVVAAPSAPSAALVVAAPSVPSAALVVAAPSATSAALVVAARADAAAETAAETAAAAARRDADAARRAAAEATRKEVDARRALEDAREEIRRLRMGETPRTSPGLVGPGPGAGLDLGSDPGATSSPVAPPPEDEEADAFPETDAFPEVELASSLASSLAPPPTPAAEASSSSSSMAETTAHSPPSSTRRSARSSSGSPPSRASRALFTTSPGATSPGRTRTQSPSASASASASSSASASPSASSSPTPSPTPSPSPSSFSVRALTDALASRDASLATTSSRADAAEFEIRRLATELAAAEARRVALESELVAAFARASASSEELSRTSEELSRTSAALRDARADADAGESNRRRLRERLDASEARCVDLAAQVRAWVDKGFEMIRDGERGPVVGNPAAGVSGVGSPALGTSSPALGTPAWYATTFGRSDAFSSGESAARWAADAAANAPPARVVADLEAALLDATRRAEEAEAHADALASSAEEAEAHAEATAKAHETALTAASDEAEAAKAAASAASAARDAAEANRERIARKARADAVASRERHDRLASELADAKSRRDSAMVHLADARANAATSAARRVAEAEARATSAEERTVAAVAAARNAARRDVDAARNEQTRATEAAKSAKESALAEAERHRAAAEAAEASARTSESSAGIARSRGIASPRTRRHADGTRARRRRRRVRSRASRRDESSRRFDIGGPRRLRIVGAEIARSRGIASPRTR